jgi:hypothetical protein
MSETIEAIADNEIKPGVRKALLATLRSELVNTELDGESAQAEDEKKGGTKQDTKRRKRGPLFLLYMKKEQATTAKQAPTTAPVARTMIAASKVKYPLRIAYDLPHMKFPIGDGATTKDKAMVTGLLDTGGCCMMGKLEWYQELHRVCPQFFDEFFKLAERRYESINIGGLKDGIWLTHVARLCMPYEDRGATMRIEIGLSSELPVDTLFGVNFQRETKMTIDLGTNKVNSPHFGDTYDIVWRSPASSDLGQIRHEAQKAPMVFFATGGQHVAIHCKDFLVQGYNETIQKALDRYIQIREDANKREREILADNEQRYGIIVYPAPDDALIGREHPYHDFSRTRRFLEVIDPELERYSQSDEKFWKTCISMAVVKKVQEWNGRFLHRTETGWKVFDDNAAREKVINIFRYKKKLQQRSSSGKPPHKRAKLSEEVGRASLGMVDRNIDV